MYCPSCGNNVNKGLKYCQSCGKRIGGMEEDKDGTPGKKLTAQLNEYREPDMSVTDRTTKTPDKVL